MTTVAFALVLASAVIHATWNFLLKRSSNKVVFFWGMAAAGLVTFAVPAVVFAVIEGFGWQALGYGLGTSTLHACYAVTLTRSYHLGDLSSVYPVSRGMGPALVPLLAVLLLGETVSALAVAGIVLVVVGIYSIHIDRRLLRDLSHPVRALTAPATRLAFLTGFVIAGYTIWDKSGLNHDLHPVTLNAFSMVGNFFGLVPVVLFTARETWRSEWRREGASMVLAGLLAPAGYLLVLIALTSTRVSYVAPSREIGIVLGAAMGVLLLREGYGTTRIWGSALVVVGVVMIAVAP